MEQLGDERALDITHETAHRKAKMLALLDRVCINRGLQLKRNDEARARAQEMEWPAKQSSTNPSGTSPTSLDSPRSREMQDTRTDVVSERTDQDVDKHDVLSVKVEEEEEVIVDAKPSDIHLNMTLERVTRVKATREGSNDQRRTNRDGTLDSEPRDGIANVSGTKDRVPSAKPLTSDQVESENGTHVPPSSLLEMNRAPSTAAELLKRLETLTPDEYEDSELHGEFRHVLHILIPSNATTALLERRGQPIQSISQQTGCTLSIREPEASPFKDDRLLRIYGTPKCISLAQRVVIAYIRVYRASKQDPNYLELSEKAPLIALPTSSITKVMNVAVASGQKNDDVEITNPLHWLVQRENVGKMMGKQGSCLASIRRTTGASIHVEESVVPGTTERRVILSGSKEAIAVAVQEIKGRAGGRPEVAASGAMGRLGQYYAIPYHAAGHLIGPQGATIRSLTQRTGARLQLPSAEDLPLGSINRILHIQGTVKQVDHARRVVIGKLRDYGASSTSPRPRTIFATGEEGDHVTMKVLLPSRICGLMLDGRGMLIQEIGKKSGAHVHFLTPHGTDKRVCVFTGDMRCVLRAQRLVLQVMAGDALSSKRAAPSRKGTRLYRVVKEKASVETDHEVLLTNEELEHEEEEALEGAEVEEPARQSARRTVYQDPLELQNEANLNELDDAVASERSNTRESSSRKVQVIPSTPSVREGRSRTRRRRSSGSGNNRNEKKSGDNKRRRQ
ncbi:hypothetical protein PsorP6_007259 [Peronosclerospora sorghi]|uniref:Uncharacterized protein n=1 Tax=Peronosclerospora sorghi TaxID=230839 RepID=A0ACC0W7K4_9STRA|nr:hypothetical protein PsorP6_007259 [Peronosclerospora sorghi]